MDGFETFWIAFPRKVGKGAARKSFEKALKKTTLATMLEALKWQVHQPGWRDGKYVPHPSTWLNQERWDDEPFHASREPRRPRRHDDIDL